MFQIASPGPTTASSSNSLNKTDEEISSNDSTIPTLTQSPLPFDISHFDRTLVVIVHFLAVVAESFRHCSPEETYKLKKLVYELVKLNPRNSKSSTLLHLASSRDSSSIIKNHTLNSFPSSEVIKLLLECGADPNALDAERNSPLHLAASNRNSPITSASSSASLSAINTTAQDNINNTQPTGSSNTNQTPLVLNSERDKLICLLLNAGAHLDACNCQNKTASEMYKGGKMYNVINPINYLTLQCMAAKVIQKNQIPYREHLTSKLANFVSIH